MDCEVQVKELAPIAAIKGNDYGIGLEPAKAIACRKAPNSRAAFRVATLVALTDLAAVLRRAFAFIIFN